MSKNKVVTSAVIVGVPAGLDAQIQTFRAKHDKAFERWMPHINLLYPFIPSQEFSQNIPTLVSTTTPIKPFTLCFNSVAHFTHGRSCTLYLSPTTIPTNAVQELQAALEAAFPFCNDLSTRDSKGFIPHLTLGQFKENEIAKVKTEFMKTWKPLTFQVEAVQLINRTGSEPFKIHTSIPLQGGETGDWGADAEWGEPAADWGASASAADWGDVQDDWAQTEVLVAPVPATKPAPALAKLPPAPQPFLAGKGKIEREEAPTVYERQPRPAPAGPRIERKPQHTQRMMDRRPAEERFPPLAASGQPVVKRNWGQPPAEQPERRPREAPSRDDYSRDRPSRDDYSRDRPSRDDYSRDRPSRGDRDDYSRDRDAPSRGDRDGYPRDRDAPSRDEPRREGPPRPAPPSRGGRTPVAAPSTRGGRTPAAAPFARGGRTPVAAPFTRGGRTPVAAGVEAKKPESKKSDGSEWMPYLEDKLKAIKWDDEEEEAFEKLRLASKMSQKMFVVLDMTQDGKKINRLIHELLYGTLPTNFVLLICRNKHLRPICVECDTTISKKLMARGQRVTLDKLGLFPQGITSVEFYLYGLCKLLKERDSAPATTPTPAPAPAPAPARGGSRGGPAQRGGRGAPAPSPVRAPRVTPPASSVKIVVLSHTKQIEKLSKKKPEQIKLADMDNLEPFINSLGKEEDDNALRMFLKKVTSLKPAPSHPKPDSESQHDQQVTDKKAFLKTAQWLDSKRAQSVNLPSNKQAFLNSLKSFSSVLYSLDEESITSKLFHAKDISDCVSCSSLCYPILKKDPESTWLPEDAGPEEIGLRTVKQWIRSQPVVMLPQSLDGLHKFICSLKIKIQVQPTRLLDEAISNEMLEFDDEGKITYRFDAVSNYLSQFPEEELQNSKSHKFTSVKKPKQQREESSSSFSGRDDVSDLKCFEGDVSWATPMDESQAQNCFDSMGLIDEILRGVYAYGFEKPSLIQQYAIPALVQLESDFLLAAPPGCGKTAAYVIPILNKIARLPPHQCSALFLVPTRELANQVNKVINALGDYAKIQSYVSVGGSSVSKDVRTLKSAQVIVGTPGRICDMIMRKAIDVSRVKYVVLDEADSLLTDNPDAIYDICQALPGDFTAKFLRPMAIGIEGHHTLEHVTQYKLEINNDASFMPVFWKFWEQEYDNWNKGSVVLFVKTRRDVDVITEEAQGKDYTVSSLHGDLCQDERDKIMNDFRSGNSRVLITCASSLRGIDVQQVSTIVNLHMPETAQKYLNQVGRAGRFGRKGTSYTLVLPQEYHLLSQIEGQMGAKLNSFSIDQ